ncbi:MAG: hypothetical protein KA354_18405 [Phycisphaerae bacterium]|nr:hypothetical protein [Phycisphaerae bacterium]
MSCHRQRLTAALLLALSVLLANLVGTAWPARAEKADSPPSRTALDETAFREELRRRGLADWLAQYDTDNPAADLVTRQSRRRDHLLTQAEASGLPAYEQRAKVAEASAILSDLIAQRPNDPNRLRWQIELARDHLERRAPDAFEAVLLHEFGGRGRTNVASAADAAIEALGGLRRDIQAAWNRVGEMDEQAVVQATASGALRELEAADRQAIMLSVWAGLYQALSTDLNEQQRSAAFMELLQEVTERQGWTERQNPGQEALRCNALVIAAVSCRQLKRFDEGAAHARRILATMTKVADPAERHRLRRASLLGILEQIRGLRDAGKFTEALGAVAQGRQWAEQTRPDDKSASLAIAILESDVLARQADPQAAAKGFHGMARALAPVQRFADVSTTHREMVYAAFGLGMDSLPELTSPPAFQMQLLAGAALRNLVTDYPPDRRRDDAALKGVVHMLLGVVAKPPEGTPPATVGELMFLLGRGFYLAGDALEACSVLCDLARKYPQHDRALMGVGQAVAIAQEMLRLPEHGQTPEARAAFLRAGRLLRDLAPNTPETKRLQYFIARAVEDGGQLREAAKEYAAVAPDDANALKAAARRARCLRVLLQQAAGDPKTGKADLGAMAEEALKAAQETVAFARGRGADKAGDPEHCLVADTVLLEADLLNSPLIARPAAAEEVLESFEERFPDCPGAVGAALRERVLALRQLKKLAEAREVVERFLRADPEHAGPVMARLLETMREEIAEASDRGNDQAVTELAEEAVRLADRLIAWFQDRPDQVTPSDTILIRVWRAWSLIDAGQAHAALPVFRELATLPKDQLPDNAASRIDVRLGEATCLLMTGKPEEAVTLFNGIWQQVPEHSPPWWQAFAGNLQCLARLGAEPASIILPIAQQRFHDATLGGPRWKRAIESVERDAEASAATTRASPRTPASTQPADR